MEKKLCIEMVYSSQESGIALAPGNGKLPGVLVACRQVSRHFFVAGHPLAHCACHDTHYYLYRRQPAGATRPSPPAPTTALLRNPRKAGPSSLAQT